MKNGIRQLAVASIALAVFVSSGIAQASTREDGIAAARKINAANDLVRAGKIAEAIEDYQEIIADTVDREQLNYNLGVAEYRSGDIEAAKARFTEAASAQDPALAARSRYNLGNCFYSDAIETAEQDKPTAIGALRTAIGHYRGSLAAEPNNTDARANIELAVQLLKKLQQEQRQEEQQNQQQEQPDSDQQEQEQQQNDQQQKDQSSNDGASDQNTPSEQSDSGQERTDSNDTQNPENESGETPNDSSAEDQPSNSASEQQQDAAAPEDSQGDESESDESNPHSSPGATQPEEPTTQNPNDQNLGSQQRQPHSPMQDDNTPQAADAAGEEETDNSESAVPEGELSPSGEQEPETNPNARVGIADPNAEQGLMTKEEALKMLQAVRDRDMLRRLRQEQVERSRHIPTDRDW